MAAPPGRPPSRRPGHRLRGQPGMSAVPGCRAVRTGQVGGRPQRQARRGRAAGTGRPGRPCPATGAAGRCCTPAPRIDRGLGARRSWRTAGVIQQLGLQGLMPPLDLPRRGRRPRLGQRCLMPFSRQIRSNSTSAGRGLVYRPVNCLPLSVSTSSGIPNWSQGGRERPADRAAGGPPHHRGDHAEPGMVIHPGDQLRLRAVGQEHRR